MRRDEKLIENEKIIVIIPAYNAEFTIFKVFEELNDVHQFFDEIIILDDGSTDNTFSNAEKLRDMWKNKKKIILLKHEKNMGYGGTQKHLFKKFLERNGDIAILIHADNQYSPYYIKFLLPPILKKKADIVLGSRFYKNMRYYAEMPVYKVLGNRFLTLIENIILNSNLSEFHTGLRAYTKRAINKLDFEKFSDLFVFDSEILFQAHDFGLKITEVPTYAKYEIDNVSHLNSIKYGLNILALILLYILKRIKPMRKYKKIKK